MNVNIGKAIALLLQKKHKVSLTGLGTFKVQSIPASISDDSKEILPPSAKIIFEETESIDHSLIEFISDYYEMPKTQALKYVNTFTKQFKQKLKIQKTLNFNGLGKFSMSRSKLVFKAAKSLEDSIYFGLTPAKLNNITTPIVSNDIKSRQAETINENFGKELAEVSKAMPVTMNMDQNKDSKAFDSYQYEEESKWSFLLKPLLIVLGLILLSVILFKTCSHFINKDKQPTDTTESTLQSDNELNDTLKAIDSAIEDGAATETAQDIVKYHFYPHDLDADIDPISISDLSYHPSTCIIIVGSFSKLSNAANYQILLEKEGYDTFVQAKGDMTRVGFYADCADKDLQSFITQIRKDINPNAWYLSPRLHVD